MKDHEPTPEQTAVIIIFCTLALVAALMFLMSLHGRMPMVVIAQ